MPAISTATLGSSWSSRSENASLAGSAYSTREMPTSRGERSPFIATNWDDLENERIELSHHASREPLVPCSHRGLRYSLVISVIASLPVLADRSAAQTRPEIPTQLTVARIVSSEFHGEVSGPRHWLKGDLAYLGLEWSEGGNGQEIVRHDPVSGKCDVLVPARELVPRGAKGPLHIDDFAINGDGRKLLLFTNTRRVWRLNTRGDYSVLDRDANSLRKLGGKAPEASFLFAAFDPQGRGVAYVRESNLYVEDLAEGTIVSLTADGSPTLINSTFDWVYEFDYPPSVWPGVGIFLPFRPESADKTPDYNPRGGRFNRIPRVNRRHRVQSGGNGQCQVPKVSSVAFDVPSRGRSRLRWTNPGRRHCESDTAQRQQG